jgi:hypothetical protein
MLEIYEAPLKARALGSSFPALRWLGLVIIEQTATAGPANRRPACRGRSARAGHSVHAEGAREASGAAASPARALPRAVFAPRPARLPGRAELGGAEQSGARETALSSEAARPRREPEGAERRGRRARAGRGCG